MMVRSERTWMDFCRVTVCGGVAESFAWIVKMKSPSAVGVPVIAPVDAFTAVPVGREPDITDQVTG